MSGKALLAVIRASRPTFRSRLDKLAFAVHSAVLVNGFRLVAVGENCTDEAPPADAPEVDITGWDSQPGEYSFKFAADDSGAAGLLVKAVSAEPLLLVSFLPFGDVSNPQSLELDADRFTTDAQNVTTSFANLDELAGKVQSILGPTRPTAGAAGRQNAAASASTAATPSTTTAHPLPSDPRRSPLDDPLRDPNPDAYPIYPPGRDPLLVGGGDLDPLAVRRPGRPFGGGFPEGPGGVGGIPGGLSGGGMHVGPDHPFFRGGMRNPGMRPGMVPPGLPPGARWDPIRPPGMQGFNPDDFQQQPGRIHPDMAQPGPGRDDWDAMFG